MDGGETRQIIVGVCAMRKKSRSKPMLEILERLSRFEFIKPLIFEEEVILKQRVEDWPVCDCLISFHSKGFPLDKAVSYAQLQKPMLINDLHMQYKIQDRREVHKILDEYDIDQPRYAVLDTNSSDPSKCTIVETEDLVEVNNMTFHKPFVEKPVNAEDHNVYIYFPVAAGGGSQRLFRKIGSRSSVYSGVGSVRKTGSFIYEDFMPTDGTDVKVYTVGPDYAHAEARKSPALDGKVERDKDGKEIRYPVLLSSREKLLARNVCLAFKQNVCGFDLLRANGRSYVCDVNGFSFVKTSPKYYDDCAKILGNMIMRQIAPQLHIPYSITYQPEDIPIVPTTYGTMMELRCVIAVIRHGDRTPKQKMKMEVRHKKFFYIFEKYGGFKSGHLKLKHPKQLQEVLDIARFLLDEIEHQAAPEVEEKRSKLEQLKAVLEMYGHFSGINRKIQFKYQPHGAPKKSSSDDDELPREPSLVLILKWGGELTPAGKIQAEELGKAFRWDYGSVPGLGLMRLQSTFRHDLKIYASDEGRVQMTAAAFAKGLLALEGELTPILVQMVKSANMNGLLDNDNEASNYQNVMKDKLQCHLNEDREFDEDDVEKLNPTGSRSLSAALHFVKNPYQACCHMHSIMLQLLSRIHQLRDDPRAPEMKLYHSESWELMTRRWSKLLKDFKSHKSNLFDISKVPDIYDCIKYDLQHNMKILRFPAADELHALSKAMADIVIPQEYGMSREEKLAIGQRICTPLLRKILTDLHRNVDEESTRLDSRYSEGVSSPHRHVRTRLYFTSESHIHSLLTVLRYGGFCEPQCDEQWARAMDYVDRVTELNYMTQIVIMTYEDPTKDPQHEERFHVELHFSPGAYCVGSNKNYPPGPGYRSQMSKQHDDVSMGADDERGMRDVATSPGQLASQDDASRGTDCMDLLAQDEGSTMPLEDIVEHNEAIVGQCKDSTGQDEGITGQDDGFRRQYECIAGQDKGFAGQERYFTGQDKSITGHSEIIAGQHEGIAGQDEAIREKDEGIAGQDEGITGLNEGIAGQDEAIREKDEGIAGQDEGITEHKEGITGQNQVITGQNNGIAVQDKGIVGQHEGIAGQDKGIVGQDKGIVGQDKGIVGQDKGISGQNEGISRQDKGILRQNEGISPQNEGISPQDEGIAGEGEGIRGQDEGIGEQDKGIAGQNEGVTGHKEGITRQKEDIGGLNEDIALITGCDMSWTDSPRHKCARLECDMETSLPHQSSTPDQSPCVEAPLVAQAQSDPVTRASPDEDGLMEDVHPGYTVSDPLPIARRRHQSAESSLCEDSSKDSLVGSEKRSASFDKSSGNGKETFLLAPQKSTSLEGTVKRRLLPDEQDEARRHSFLSLFANKDFERMDIALPSLVSLVMETQTGQTTLRRCPIISTTLISGSASAPTLTQSHGLEGWRVSSVRPLETLHNALTLKQMESFLQRVTDSVLPTPFSSPSQGTPTCVTPRFTNPAAINLPLLQGSSSASSSSGPSSPTSPDDIMRKLKLLIRHSSDSTEPSTNHNKCTT